MKNKSIYYSVGALLYCPANRTTIVDTITSEKIEGKYSLALCLEDTVNDNCVEEAENIMLDSINKIYNAHTSKSFYLPKLFIRVRNHMQILSLSKRLGESTKIVTGFIVPKFSVENAQEYIDALIYVNKDMSNPKYLMPIYESESIIDPRTRFDYLYHLKKLLAPIEEYVLNIRVGGNDLCHTFGYRRHCNESIHSIRPIANLLADIITVYGRDYVVSGPVWEYYSGPDWETGLKNEIHEDILCGFIGKTVIHPNQIAVINECYRVSREDYDDACSILGWDKSNSFFVSGSATGHRMNELKTHGNWAEKIIFLAENYGIKDCPPHSDNITQ